MNSHVILASKISEKSRDIDADGHYLKNFKELLLRDGYSLMDINEIVNNSIRTLLHTPDPKAGKREESTGIIIGKIQSGKTSNYIGLISLAFDNGYNIVTVLAGTKLNLITQNSKRIKTFFSYNGEDSVVVIDTSDKNAQNYNDLIKRLLKTGKKVIVVATKSSSGLPKVTELFSGRAFEKQPVLILDDEGDEFSLNTEVKKKKQSALYGKILELKKAIPIHSFISITATPQANLIISKIDEISPKFGIFVQPGQGYCGLETFHCEDSEYLIKVPDEDSDVLFNEGLPESLSDAFFTYIVSCAVTAIRHGSKEKLSMLIHPSHLINDVNIVKDKIDIFIQEWRTSLSNPNDVSYEDLEMKVTRGIKLLDNTLDNRISFELIKEKLEFVFNHLETHIAAGKDDLQKDDDLHFNYNIYIGGNKLGRGLTIKNLAVTYIVRGAKGKSNVDTLQQRARWFGYREKHLDLCRIFATEKILDDFEEIREHEDYLWSTIAFSLERGYDLHNIDKIFRLKDSLRMTRSNVGSAKPYKIKNWHIDMYFNFDTNLAQNNIDILEKFLENQDKNIKIVTNFDAEPNLEVHNVDFNDFLENIISKIYFDPRSEINPNLIKKIIVGLNKKGIAPICDVVWMRGKTYSKVNASNDKMVNYFQGSRKNYVGDRHYPKEDKIQVQIRYLLDRETSKVSPTLALYFPDNYLNNLYHLVVAEDM